MNFEKIERAYELLVENVQVIEASLNMSAYDALIEQNSYYLGATMSHSLLQSVVINNNTELSALSLTPEEWRRTYQFLLIKLSQIEPLQVNHQLTPDSIGFLILFLLETLMSAKDEVAVLEIGSGTGNLAQTLMINSRKQLDYLGMEIDDLLIDLAASIADVIGTDVNFIQEDAVRPQILSESDVIISDLPVGYYPNDKVASRYQVAASNQHTYAHHLLMEQGLKYLKEDGVAIFLVPVDLLSSSQSDLLKKWLSCTATIMALIGLPEGFFGHAKNAKSILILKKKQQEDKEVFTYQLKDLQDPDSLRQFTTVFRDWVDTSNGKVS